MLKLKLQYFGLLVWRVKSLEKTLMLGKIESKRKRWQQKIRCLNSITDSMDMNLSKLLEIVKDREVKYTAVHGVAKSWTWFSYWTRTATETFITYKIHNFPDQLLLVMFMCNWTNLDNQPVQSKALLHPPLCVAIFYEMPCSLVPDIFINKKYS